METSFYTEDELAGLGLKAYGKNVRISRNAKIYSANQISIGDNVRIDDFCILSGHIELGNHIHIAAYCALFGANAGIFIKDFAGLSSRNTIYAASDDYSGSSLTNPTIPSNLRKIDERPVIINKHVIIGCGSCILPGVEIGEGTSVGAMSLVTKKLSPWKIYFGAPCRIINERKMDLLSLEKDFLFSKTEAKNY